VVALGGARRARRDYIGGEEVTRHRVVLCRGEGEEEDANLEVVGDSLHAGRYSRCA
jgi:hypothetical protein